MAKRKYLGNGVYLNTETGEFEGGNTSAPPSSSPPLSLPPLGSTSTLPKPSSHMFLAILSAIIFLPLGIVAIIQAAKVNTLYAAGSYWAASRASKRARNWAIGAIALVVLAYVYGRFASPDGANDSSTTRTQVETALTPNYYCSASSLNVRERPASNGKILGKLDQYDNCYVYSYDASNRYATIDFKGTKAYVNAEYLRPKNDSGGNNVIPSSVYAGASKASGKTQPKPTERKTNSLNFEQQYNEALGLYNREKYRDAFNLFKPLAEQGDAKAQNKLGRMYQEGRSVPKDDAKAVEWYRKAAEQGHASAQNNLGWMYQEGRGVPKDDTKAVEWYRKAVEQGDANAQNNLGNMYYWGRGGLPQNDAKAMEWYRKAAEQEVDYAQCSLGWIYANGRGVPKDYAKAAEWYRKAAEQGNADAKYRLEALKKAGKI